MLSLRHMSSVRNISLYPCAYRCPGNKGCNWCHRFTDSDFNFLTSDGGKSLHMWGIHIQQKWNNQIHYIKSKWIMRKERSKLFCDTQHILIITWVMKKFFKDTYGRNTQPMSCDFRKWLFGHHHLHSCPAATKILLLLSRITCKVMQAVKLHNMASLLCTYLTKGHS